MDVGEITLLVLLDLSKCFDVIDHSKLITKLQLYGIDSEWFESYLSDHYQYVRLDSKESGQDNPVRNQNSPNLASSPGSLKSKPAKNPIGVYQGTCLGPLLFSIFSNDLSLHVSPNVKIIQYCDDTQIIVTGQKCNIRHMILEMENALAKLHLWFTQNSMKLNSNKTQLIVLGTRQMLRDIPSISLTLNGATVSESKRVKNLGLIMDKHLSFEPHVDRMVGKCTGLLLGLFHARHRLPRETLKPLVNSLILSSLRYCISVYGSCSAQCLHRVQKVINFSARVITGRRRSDRISDAVRDLGWLPAREMAQYHALCLLKRIMVAGEPAALAHQIMTRRAHRDRPTRQDTDLCLPRIRSESGRRSFVYRAPAAFNTIPVGIRSGTPSQFKRMIRKRLRCAAGQ